jgi:hypothetical protein
MTWQDVLRPQINAAQGLSALFYFYTLSQNETASGACL